MRNVLLLNKILGLTLLRVLLGGVSRVTYRWSFNVRVNRAADHLGQIASDLIRDGYRRGILTSWAHRPY
jgi:hypothetical protein